MEWNISWKVFQLIAIVDTPKKNKQKKLFRFCKTYNLKKHFGKISLVSKTKIKISMCHLCLDLI